MSNDRYLVTLEDELVSEEFLVSVLEGAVLDLRPRRPVYLPEIGVAALALSPGESDQLGADRRVRRVQLDPRIWDAVPSDAFGPPPPPSPAPVVVSIGYVAAGPPLNIKKIGADSVWPCSKGKGVKVAMLDSGILGSHAQLEVAGGVSFVDAEPDWLADPLGHGTRVAGILAARADASLSGVVGVAPECELYSVKVIDSGNNAMGSAILQGMVWAANKGMDVINMSVRPGRDDAAEQPCPDEVDRAVSFIWQSGGFFVNAAGNSGLLAYPELRWPAICPYVVAVGAVDENGERRPITCFGPDDPDRGVELMAPGWAILTTSAGPTEAYETLAKTSAACPHVAGTAALIKARSPNLGPAEIRQRLRDTAIDMSPPANRDEKTGYGRLDAYAAVLPTAVDRILCSLSKWWVILLIWIKNGFRARI